MKFCPQCGAQQQDEAAFCTQCSAALEVNSAPAAETPAAQAPAAAPAPAAKKPLPKNLIAIIAGVLALVIVAGIVIACLPGSDPVYGVYYKDGEIYITDFESEEPVLLTDDLGSWSNGVLSAVVMTQDGKYVLYPDEVERGDKSVTIFFRETLDPEADSVKMAAKVTEYFVADDSDTVIYLTEKGELCRYSLSSEESETIAKNVKNYDCSEDGQNIFYETETTKKDKTVRTAYRVLGGDIEESVELPKMYSYEYSEDLTVILYEEEHKETDKADKKYKTYMIDENGEETVIDTEVENFWIMEDNSIYYRKSAKGQKLSKFIKNDTGETVDMSVFDEYTISFYEFYKFDGEAVLIADGLAGISCYSYEDAIFTYSIADKEGKVKLSELRENIYDISDAAWYVRENLQDGKGIIAGDEAAKIEYDEIYRYGFSDDFDRIYIISEWDEEEDCGALYVADLDGANVGELEAVCEDVSSAMFIAGDLFYIQDDDLYIEGEDKAIAKDALGAMYAEETDTILVGYDRDEKDGTYAIGIYDGEVTEICGKVNDIDLLESGMIVYEDDDDTYFYYVDGESVEIDDDISFRQIRIGGWGYLDLYWDSDYGY